MSEQIDYSSIPEVLRSNYTDILPAEFEELIDDRKLALLTKRDFKKLSDKIMDCGILLAKLQNRRLKVNRDKARRKNEKKSKDTIRCLKLNKRNLLLKSRELLKEITFYQEATLNMYFQDYDCHSYY